MTESTIAITYRHKKVMRFAVGKFEFKNHLLRLTTEEDIAEFERIYETLQFQDKNNIVQLKVEENETPVGTRPSLGIRNAVSTLDIPDKINPALAGKETATADSEPQQQATPAKPLNLGGLRPHVS